MNNRIVYQNEAGFILVEQLIVMIIISQLATLLIALLVSYTTTQSPLDEVTVPELAVIATQLQQEVTHKTQLYAPTSSKLAMTDLNGDVITYFIKNNNLIRQRNGTGNEILLYDCQSFQVTPLSSHQVRLTLSTKAIEHYTIYLSTFYTPLDLLLPSSS